MKLLTMRKLSSSIWNQWMEEQQHGSFLVLLLSLKLSSGVYPFTSKDNCMILLLTRNSQGFPLSFGVFQNYYSHLPQFADNPYIPIVGTVASGISYLGAPLVTPFIKRYSRYQRQMIWVGCETTLPLK
jgi:hypothetical protein